MPITEITYQPQFNSLNAAFRPIVFRCKAKIPNPTPENYAPTVVYCDIYLNDIYYKSVSRSAFINDDGIAPEYEFDIQDAVQEVMTASLPIMDGPDVEDHTDNLKVVFVKFRNAYLDTNGFNVSEQTAPVQGTSSSAPVAGDGAQSNSFYVLYAVIQHEENQNLKELLNSYKTGIWNENSFPLTKRPQDVKICRNDSSHFPILTDKVLNKLCIKIKTFSGEEIELCSKLKTTCPFSTDFTYSFVDNGDGTQTFTFDWVNPADMSVVTGMNIYYQEVGQTTWQSIFGSYNPTRSITLPFGKYNFRFSLVGSCYENSIDVMPGFNNIGMIANDNPPTVVIRWADNLGNEDRSCTQNICNYTIDVLATDPDNDITNIKILRSLDNGTTWDVFIANLTATTFSDNVSDTGSKKYKAVVTDGNAHVVESNILTFKGSSVVKVEQVPDVFITIYKADSGSHYIGQIKFYGLAVSTVDSSNITKVEIFVRFRAIGENIWWEKTETHIVSSPSTYLFLNRQFVYGFKDPSKYIGTRDWNGADSAFVEFKIYTSSGDIKTFNLYTIQFPWYADYNQAIV